MNLREQQIEREREDAEGAVEKYRNHVKGHLGHSSAGMRLIFERIEEFIKTIEAEQNALKTSTHAPIHGPMLSVIQADALGLITLQQILIAMGPDAVRKALGNTLETSADADAGDEKCEEEDSTDANTEDEKCEEEKDPLAFTNVARSLGEHCEIHWKRKPTAEKEAAIEKYCEKFSPSSLAKGKLKITANLGDDWTKSFNDIHLGVFLLNLAATENIIEIAPEKVYETAPITTNRVRLVRSFENALCKELRHFEYLLTPLYRPMLCEPEPWTGLHQGGYLSDETRKKTPLVVHKNKTEVISGVTKAISEGRLDTVLASVNALQRTSWRINKNIYYVMRKTVPLEYERRLFPLPHWAERKNGLLRYHTRLGACIEFLDGSSFYLPYYLDFRGRAYCYPVALNYQLDDIGRALMEFAVAEPWGENGVRWLKRHLSNCFNKGDARLSLREREEWVDQNSQRILACAAKPWKEHWWLEARKPWRFLAACYEWKAYTVDGATTSRLPIEMDGSCNGFQHVSAVKRNREGARLTNMLPRNADEKPEDFYSQIAEQLTQIIDKAVEQRKARAKLLSKAVNGPITRDLIKTPIMANLYGQGFKGMTKAFMKEEFAMSIPIKMKFAKGRYYTVENRRYAACLYLSRQLIALVQKTMICWPA